MTFLGKHTIAELHELIVQKDYTLRELRDAFDRARNAWNRSDAKACSEWERDWRALSDRYNAAREKGLAAIRFSERLGAPNYIPAEEEYQAILTALTRDRVRGYQKGDLQDLHNRLARVTMVSYATPPPASAPDADIATIQSIDRGTATVSRAAAWGAGAVIATAGIGGLLYLGFLSRLGGRR